MAVAKKMLSFSGSTPTVYDNIFDWSGDNTDMISSVSFDFKGAGKGRYTALKMGYVPFSDTALYSPFSDTTLYSAMLDKIMEEEWENMQEMLQEGLKDWVLTRWRSAADAISNVIDTVKNTYQKYVQGVVEKLIKTIRDIAAKGIQKLFDFLGIELSAEVSFGTM